MHRDNGYFSASGYRDKLMPGKELNILHSIDFREYYVGQSDMPELVLKTEDELEAMRQESVEKETGIYEKLRTDTVQWEDQAGRTLLLERALEYVRTGGQAHRQPVEASEKRRLGDQQPGVYHAVQIFSGHLYGQKDQAGRERIPGGLGHRVQYPGTAGL